MFIIVIWQSRKFGPPNKRKVGYRMCKVESQVPPPAPPQPKPGKQPIPQGPIKQTQATENANPKTGVIIKAASGKIEMNK